MQTDTRDLTAEALLASAHECVHCRSLAVEVVLDLDDLVASGRCGTCGREGALVPAGRAC